MYRPASWDTTHRSFILAADYREGRGGSVPLEHVAPRCFTCARVRPAGAAQFTGTGKGANAGPWRAVALPADPDRGQLRWLTEQGAFMVVPICPRCQRRETVPLDFDAWDQELEKKRAALNEREQPEVEIERSRKGVR